MDMELTATVSRTLPTAKPDDTKKRLRADRFGGLLVGSRVPTKHLLADEGSYFAFSNPTPGTAIAYGSAGTQASFSDTVPFILVQNQNPVGGKRVFLDYLRLIQIGGTAPATTTSVQAALKLDTINRLNTAGTMTAITPAIVNSDDPESASKCKIWIPSGAVATIPSPGPNARLIGRAQLKGGPTLALDEYTIAFGLGDATPAGGYLTTVASYVTRMPAFVIAPQEFAVLHLWFPGGATNPFSFEFDGALWEA